ncbi:HAMP domain-containing protein [Actinoplanes sp. LDG1-06]|uniref:histidine kinase n=1 Tax=Paractinoplanes ovalisporus TaxID=2810368 RepID=A0ABS2A575_9ACTN|nr:ATP-binding protein [Actinoplanes ovalisporus]MBM2614998.1 HAMP domain-containing protein [Actinoplanes ovalisporus]
MLSRLTLRWRLTLLHTGVFLVAGAVVLAVVYYQNRRAVLKISMDVDPEFAPPGTAIALQKSEAVSTILVQWAAALVAMTAIAGILAWWVTGRVLDRVHGMTVQARRISTANLHERIAVRGPDDEIKELSDTFDDLLGRLEDAFSAQARFIANASHELRTPLAVARTTIQVGLATRDPERTERVRRELLANNDRCIALINGLLTLARGEQSTRRDPVSLAAVVDEVTGAFPGVRTAVEGDRTVLGDPVLLTQLVRNLVDNAVRYNVPDGSVLVSLSPDGPLTVENTGPVIEPGEVERLFEPFQRGAGRTGHTDGAGLGLSIVRAVATATGGEVTARPRDGGGLVVDVRVG